jgi:hypothetical protein
MVASLAWDSEGVRERVFVTSSFWRGEPLVQLQGGVLPVPAA